MTLKSLLTLERSIYSGVFFQYSFDWYTEQIKLLKMLNFGDFQTTPEKYMIYEVSFLEGCWV